jgi:hypothetical protein
VQEWELTEDRKCDRVASAVAAGPIVAHEYSNNVSERRVSAWLEVRDAVFNGGKRRLDPVRVGADRCLCQRLDRLGHACCIR